MSKIYDEFYDRVPNELLRHISNGCLLGDKAYSIITNSEPRFFQSVFSYGLRSRIHEKAIQLYLQEKLDSKKAIEVYAKHIGYGNRVINICGADFGMLACHIKKNNTLPQTAKYKIKACDCNPGKNFYQFNFFVPPIAEQYKCVEFFITLFFDGNKTIPNLILPDNSFSVILESRPIVSAIASEEESTHIERLAPQIIEELGKAYGQA